MMMRSYLYLDTCGFAKPWRVGVSISRLKADFCNFAEQTIFHYNMLYAGETLEQIYKLTIL